MAELAFGAGGNFALRGLIKRLVRWQPGCAASVYFWPVAASRVVASTGAGAVGSVTLGGFGGAVSGKLMRPVQHGARSDWPDKAQFIV